MKKYFNAFTTANAGQRAPLFGWMARGHVAFTMAEILLSLTIIGVVAAITLPSLTGNINERTWNTQRKALYARFSQAISLMPSLNGYGADNADTAAETFITSGLSKVLKINNICSHSNYGDCGFPSKFTTIGSAAGIISTPTNLQELNEMFNGSYVNSYGVGWESATPAVHSQTITKVAAFETANGESILTYYYPLCKNKIISGSNHNIIETMCVNFVYDLNGKKGPNTVGKDIGFITAFYPSDSSVVAPVALQKDGAATTSVNAPSVCTALDPESRAPNIEEMEALFINTNLVGLHKDVYLSSTRNTIGDPNTSWRLSHSGNIFPANASTTPDRIRCIQR